MLSSWLIGLQLPYRHASRRRSSSQKYKQWDCQKRCGVAAVWLLLAFGVATLERAEAQAFGEIWIWDEAPIVRTVSSGGNLTIDLRNLGHGEEGSTYQSFTFTVITTQADSLPGFADTKPSWIAHSAGVLTVSNAVAGTYSFTMRARKSTPPLSPLWSGKVGVRVTVNSPPVAVNDAYSQTHATTVDHNVLANDSDPNGDALTLATEDSSYSTIVGNQLRFAAPAVSGTYVVTYTVSDGKGGTGTATATFTVPAFNVSPVAVNDTATASSGVPKIIQVLANDTDSDGTVTQALIAVAPAQGTASVNPNGTVTYTSSGGYTGPDSFTYRAVDNQGAQSQVASVSITVEPAPPSILGYAYDALGRLSTSTVSTGPGGATQTWSGYCYDASGNRTNVTSGSGTPGSPCN